MQVIKVGERYDIYPDSVETFDTLPSKTFIIRFSEMSGFFLEEYVDLETNEEKVYGVHERKANKVLKNFEKVDRNLGVILSGSKGIGKSLFARMLSNKAINKGIPVIIVERFIPGIHSFIEKIDQEVLVLFDEFDKTFGNIRTKENEADPQAGLLSLFDGVSPGKKLFVITCNDIRNLNDYLINRPGRFHYHFRFKSPTPEEVKEYLTDKLSPEFHKEIGKVVLFSQKINLTYDCLRAIIFELNNGESFEEAIEDLNIINMNNERYNITLYFENGNPMTAKEICMDIFSGDDNEYVNLYDSEGRDIISVEFNTSKCVSDFTTATTFVAPEHLKLNYDTEYYSEEIIEKAKELKPLRLEIVRARDKSIHYTV